jgi:phosphoribosyl 1,2-cyclic phosphodiesterase
VDFRPLASGSSGNCYRVDDGSTALLLECGLPLARIRQALDFRLRDIEGCLVTHEHGDHAKSVSDLMRAGVNVYASPGTWAALFPLKREAAYRARSIDDLGGQFTIGTWIVTPFEAAHDAAEPLGFLLDSYVTGERLLYSGDTCYIHPRFAGLTHVAIECNNTWDAIRQGEALQAVRNRVVRTHMSLETVKDFLAANDLTRVSEIWLLHLSDQHSDAAAFVREIQEQTGKVVRVA